MNERMYIRGRHSSINHINQSTIAGPLKLVLRYGSYVANSVNVTCLMVSYVAIGTVRFARDT